MKLRLSVFLVFLNLTGIKISAQRFLSETDSSLLIKDSVWPVIKKLEHFKITGYIQPQFQYAQRDGMESYGGGNFSPTSKSRFMLRRARLKVEFAFPFKMRKRPSTVFVFQIDATERGVTAKDMYVKIYEPKKSFFYVTTGLFARPFGYEVNLSSYYRESPDRGRMSQILLPGERDLGAMISYEPFEKTKKSVNIKVDLGVFNGQGLSGTTDFDNIKDLAARFYIKPYKINQFELSGGVSLFMGGWRNSSLCIFRMNRSSTSEKIFIKDSAHTNVGKQVARRYYGLDIQLKKHHQWGTTEWRAEYWRGVQSGTANSMVSLGSLAMSNGTPLQVYIRPFQGGFFYFIQSIANEKHQLILKYDWFDPNRAVSKTEIGAAETNLTFADIQYSTFGLGYIYHINAQAKVQWYYDIVTNEKTLLHGYTSHIKNNLFTCRLQFGF